MSTLIIVRKISDEFSKYVLQWDEFSKCTLQRDEFPQYVFQCGRVVLLVTNIWQPKSVPYCFLFIIVRKILDEFSKYVLQWDEFSKCTLQRDEFPQYVFQCGRVVLLVKNTWQHQSVPYCFLFISFFVESGLKNITMTWDARLAENTKLEFREEHDLFVQTGECRGYLGRNFIKNLHPLTTCML